MDRMELYKDIAKRTGGDVYIGVVGPVRTGKSTFIKRFMDLMVIPDMADEYERARLTDELPQSAAGRTIMTTQPKFVPNEAAELYIDENVHIRIRMVDCVGYLVEGAEGHIENDAPRMVRTPWFDHDIPFEDAAEIGTKKVITEHSTIGLVVTTDGSITKIGRGSYVEAEERVINELKAQGKPFAMILNSLHPALEETVALAEELSNKYGTCVIPMDVLNMSAGEIIALLENILLEFPISMAHIRLPSWMSVLGRSHWLVKRVMEPLCAAVDGINKMADYPKLVEAVTGIEGFEGASLISAELGSGMICVELRPESGMFYKVLGEECGYEIEDDAHLIATIKDFVAAKREYGRIEYALKSAYRTGYGMVPPEIDEMELCEPEIVQQGSRFGVKLKAKASGMHIIRVDVESEVSPLVGTEEQSEEFMSYLLDTFQKDPASIWQTNIFGKPLYDLVRDGMNGKVNRLPDNVQMKLKETLERMVNDGCSGLICILL